MWAHNTIYRRGPRNISSYDMRCYYLQCSVRRTQLKTLIWSFFVNYYNIIILSGTFSCCNESYVLCRSTPFFATTASLMFQCGFRLFLCMINDNNLRSDNTKIIYCIFDAPLAATWSVLLKSQTCIVFIYSLSSVFIAFRNLSIMRWSFYIFTRGQFWPSGIVVACVCLSVCVSVCVCVRQPRAYPDHKSPHVQARTTKFGQKVQKNLVEVPIILGGDWLWPSRSNWTWKAKFTPFSDCPCHNSPHIQARTIKFGQKM